MSSGALFSEDFSAALPEIISAPSLILHPSHPLLQQEETVELFGIQFKVKNEPLFVPANYEPAYVGEQMTAYQWYKQWAAYIGTRPQHPMSELNEGLE